MALPLLSWLLFFFQTHTIPLFTGSTDLNYDSTPTNLKLAVKGGEVRKRKGKGKTNEGKKERSKWKRKERRLGEIKEKREKERKAEKKETTHAYCTIVWRNYSNW